MFLYVVVLVGLAFILKHFIFIRITTKQKVILTFSLGVLLVSASLGLFLSTKEPNLYEKLEIGRMMPKEEILKLLKKREDLIQYYEEVKNENYEFRCLNSTNPDWLSESFFFYGTSLIIVNLVSFNNSGSSKLILLVVSLTLILEFCLLTKNLTLDYLSFTSCEMIQMLRESVPSLSFCLAMLAVINKDYLLESKKKFINKLCEVDGDFKKLERLVRQEKVFDDFDASDIIRKVIDKKVKNSIPPNNVKKYLKYAFIGYFVYSIYKQSL